MAVVFISTSLSGHLERSCCLHHWRKSTISYFVAIRSARAVMSRDIDRSSNEPGISLLKVALCQTMCSPAIIHPIQDRGPVMERIMRQFDEWTTVKTLHELWLWQAQHGGKNKRIHQLALMNFYMLILDLQDNVTVFKPKLPVGRLHCRGEPVLSAFCRWFKFVVNVCHKEE